MPAAATPDFPGCGLHIYAENNSHPAYIRTKNFLTSMNIKFKTEEWNDTAMLALYGEYEGDVDCLEGTVFHERFGADNILIVGYTDSGEWVEIVNDATDETLVHLGELFSN